jgi:hypothetical protein
MIRQPATLDRSEASDPMRTLDDFIELAENICKRRQIYVCGRSFYEVCAYLRGYAAAMDQNPFGVDHRTSFGTFVATRLGFPQKLGWPYVLIVQRHFLSSRFSLAVKGG